MRRLRDVEIRVGPIVAWLADRRLGVVLGVGVALRLAQYLAGRPYWMDEGALVRVIRGLTPSSVFGPMSNMQLAPPAFLLAEWSALRVLGDSPGSLRLVPLLGGIASVFLFAAVARRCLAPGAVLIAVAVFAVMDDPIYFASEVKQYCTDLALAIALTLMGLTIGSRPLNLRRALLMAGVGSAVAWASHPSAFVLASVGVVGMARAVRAREPRQVAGWCLVGLAWSASLLGLHAVAMAQLGHRREMWSFWAFAFPPIPPRSLADACWPARRFAFLFLNPLNFDAPIGRNASMLVALGLGLIGGRRMGRINLGRLGLVMMPLGFAFLAACLRLYPFHGRLLLFAMPGLVLLIAEGLDVVRRARGRGVISFVLLTIVLIAPAANAAYRVVVPRTRGDLNPFGDRRPASLNPDRFPF